MIARSIDTSDIAHAPPYVREIWFYLLRIANFQDTRICKRGQTVRRYQDIIEALIWYKGYCRQSYTKHQCENAMKILRRWSMITTKRTTRGLVITICNYDTYQTPANYESHNHMPPASTAREPRTPATINKNGNKEKNEKNEKKKALKQKFLQFWDDYPKKVDKSEAEQLFMKLDPPDELFKIIIAAIQAQKDSEQWQEPKYIPSPARWLRRGKWTDKLTSTNPKPQTPLPPMWRPKQKEGVA